jgi:glutamate transport system permease protein
MGAVLSESGLFAQAFATTLYLAAVSGVLSLVIGTLVAAMRVCPYLPLTIVFFFFVFVTPSMGFVFGYRTAAVVALTFYTSAFIAEAVRSGINSVAVGQAEAARSLGMSFSQNLTIVVLPQAIRTCIPPLISVLIALVKNTSVAGAFAVFELFALSKRLTNVHSADVIAILVAVALCYVIICVPLGRLAAYTEKKVAFSR